MTRRRWIEQRRDRHLWRRLRERRDVRREQARAIAVLSKFRRGEPTGWTPEQVADFRAKWDALAA